MRYTLIFEQSSKPLLPLDEKNKNKNQSDTLAESSEIWRNDYKFSYISSMDSNFLLIPIGRFELITLSFEFMGNASERSANVSLGRGACKR